VSYFNQMTCILTDFWLFCWDFSCYHQRVPEHFFYFVAIGWLETKNIEVRMSYVVM